MRPAAAALNAAYALARPLFFRMDAERAHETVLAILRVASSSSAAIPVARRLLGADDVRLRVEAFGLRFVNPVGLAAGMDKNAIALGAWAALGFGHVEIGTVTPLPQAGNPRPRVFRLPDEHGLINRMGFPNEGAASVSKRLARWRASAGMSAAGSRLVLGGNVGKGRDTALEDAPEDYARAAEALSPFVDYLVVNVSSPNTPGLRTLQAPEQIQAILEAMQPVSRLPILVKLAPDIEDDSLPEIVSAARQGGAAGLIATNTTLQRDGLVRPSERSRETGGLSGAPLRHLALAKTERLASLMGSDLSLVSAGGISTAADAQERLAAGAKLVQVYSGFVYEGPAMVSRLLAGLSSKP